MSFAAEESAEHARCRRLCGDENLEGEPGWWVAFKDGDAAGELQGGGSPAFHGADEEFGASFLVVEALSGEQVFSGAGQSGFGEL